MKQRNFHPITYDSGGENIDTLQKVKWETKMFWWVCTSFHEVPEPKKKRPFI